MSTSEEKLLANQQNALQSTGPRTPEGKARSKMNAIRHGLASKAVVLPGEERERELFEELSSSLFDDLKPAGALEELLTVKLAVNAWRWRRVLRYELGATQAGADAVENWRERKRNNRRRAQEDARTRGKSEPEDWSDTDDLQGDVESAEELLAAIDQADPLETPRENLIYFLGTEAEKAGLNVKRLMGLRGKGEWGDYVLTYVERDAVKGLFEALCKEWEATPGEGWARLRRMAKYELDNAKEAYERRLRDEERQRLRAALPEAVDMERVIRYESHLSKEFNRTLAQLEKVRNMSAGTENEPEDEQ